MDARRLLALALVVCLLVPGTVAAVRIADVHPFAAHPTTPVPADATPGEMLSNGQQRLFVTGHSSTQVEYAVENGTRREPVVFRIRYDPGDRELAVYMTGEADTPGERYVGYTYLTDGKAAEAAGSVRATSRPAFGRLPDDVRWMTATNWFDTGPGDSYARAFKYRDLPGTWRIVSRNESRIVLRANGTALDARTGENVSHRDLITVTVETGTGRIRRIEDREVEGPYTVHRTFTYDDYGEVDVQRPAGIGGPGPIELLMDALRY